MATATISLQDALYEFTVRMGDDSLILGQRLSELCGHGPILEEDIALTNISLDLIGQATSFLKYAAEVDAKGKDEDQLAFLRFDRDYKNLLLLEQPNGHFGDTIMRQFLFSSFLRLMYEKLQESKDEVLAAIAEKSLKEVKYHYKHSAEWIIRLGDGTLESHDKIQESLDNLWRFTEELFFQDEVNQILIENGIAFDLDEIKGNWFMQVTDVFTEATLKVPVIQYYNNGGRVGLHSEHLGKLLAEMQFMQRAYPGMTW
jgi:ring-1,2-phenylacetyl-CoA epoxidase subunit PaaC